MGIKTAGRLKALQYRRETAYGTIPVGNLSYAGKMKKFDHRDGFEIDKYGKDGSRVAEIIAFGRKESGYKADIGMYLDDGTYSWTDILKLAVGGPTDARADIDSYTAYMEAAPDQHYMYRGCKVNSLTLDAPGVGAPVMMSLDVYAMDGDMAATKAELLDNADADVPALLPVTYNKYPVCSLDNGITIPAMNYKITISNNIVQKEGIVEGKALRAGSIMYPGDLMDVSLEYSVASTSMMWDRLKMAASKGFTVTQDIGGYQVVFSNCWLEGDLPSRSQTGYDESLEIHASDLTWTVI